MDHLCALQRDFINLRLGTFIHWNSAAVQFHANPDIIDWEFDLENSGEPRRYPFPESDWAPRAPDCDRWAQIAKSAGCRFAVLTAKHHEGFALWPSEFGNHSVAQATVRTDIVAEFLRAFRAAGLQAGLYFSVLDLTAGIGRRSFPPAQRELVLGQVTELLTNYGEIPYFIIDGWNAPWGGPSYRELPFEEVDALVKRLQPNCLLMNIGCTEGISGTDVVFFENGAGQELTPGFAGPGALCQKRRLGARPHGAVLRQPRHFHAEPQPGPRRPHPRAAGSALCRDRRARLVSGPAHGAARRLAAALSRVPDRPPSAYAVEGWRCALRKEEILWHPLRIRPR